MHPSLLLLSSLVFASLAVFPSVSTAQSRAEKVNFLLDWVPGGFHLPFYAALDQGFFKQEGLDVTLHRGYGSGDTIKKVALKQYDVGFATLDGIIQARANENVPVKGIMVYLAREMSVIWFHDPNAIKSPKDLEGRKFASSASEGSKLLFPAFAKAAGFDANKVQWVTVEGQSKGPLLLNKQVDATFFFAYHGPRLKAQAAKLGFPLYSFSFSDYGLLLYGTGLLASDATIKEKPEMLRKLLRGVQKGMHWAKANPAKAADALVKYAPEVDARDAQAEWEVTMQYVFVEEALKLGLGRYDPARLQTTINVSAEAGKTKRIPSPSEIATSNFVPTAP